MKNQWHHILIRDGGLHFYVARVMPSTDPNDYMILTSSTADQANKMLQDEAGRIVSMLRQKFTKYGWGRTTVEIVPCDAPKM
jgi:hypothetical protein